MRFLVAIGIFVLSATTLLIGVAQRTILAPPDQYVASIESDGKSPYLVIPANIIAQHPGNPTLTAKQTGAVFVASGRESDIRAFVGNSGKSIVYKPAHQDALTVVSSAGSMPSVNPAGSDLWRSEMRTTDEAALRIDARAEGAALVASDGLAGAPQQVQLVWSSNFDPLVSNILLWVGLVGLATSALLAYLVYRQMRINRGPRRRTPRTPKPPRYRYRSVFGKPERGRRVARFQGVVSGGLILALLTGCAAADSKAGATPSPSTQSFPVSLFSGQIERILAETAQVADDADQGLNKDSLAERFDGPALQVRTTNYRLRKLNKRIAAMQAIAAKPIKFSIPAATDVWPRTMMAITDEKGDAALPQMIVMQQDTPRDNYKVWFTIRLLPGAKIPAMPPTRTGAIVVDPTAQFLKVTPQDLPPVFGDVLNQGKMSIKSPLFDLDNEFYRQLSEAQKAQVVQLKKAKIKFTHTLGDPNVISLATSSGGALVAVYQSDVDTIKPTKIGSAISVGAQEKLLLGANGSVRGVKSVYGDMLLFYVPAVDDPGLVQLLGATSGLISVSSL